MPYCTNCGNAIESAVNFCQSCGQQVGGPPIVRPPDMAVPDTGEPPERAVHEFDVAGAYAALPRLRRSGVASVLVFLGLTPFLGIIAGAIASALRERPHDPAPAGLGVVIGGIALTIVSLVLVTGPICYRELGGQPGRLRRWSRANTVVAWLILLVQALGLVAVGSAGVTSRRRAAAATPAETVAAASQPAAPPIVEAPRQPPAQANEPPPSPTPARVESDRDAMVTDAVRLLAGDGTARDPQRAHALLQQAARAQSPEACYVLAAGYASGNDAVAVDYAEALKWLLLASNFSQTDSESAAAVARSTDELRSRMTPDQIREAEVRKTAWLEATGDAGTRSESVTNAAPEVR